MTKVSKRVVVILVLAMIIVLVGCATPTPDGNSTIPTPLPTRVPRNTLPEHEIIYTSGDPGHLFETFFVITPPGLPDWACIQKVAWSNFICVEVDINEVREYVQR